MGDLDTSNSTMRSTSPISRPSSPTQVATRVLYPPLRNLKDKKNTEIYASREISVKYIKYIKSYLYALCINGIFF